MKTTHVTIANSAIMKIVLKRFPNHPFVGSPDSPFLIYDNGTLYGNPHPDGDEISINDALEMWQWVPASRPPEFIEGEYNSRNVLITEDGKTLETGYFRKYLGAGRECLEWIVYEQSPDRGEISPIYWREMPFVPSVP